MAAEQMLRAVAWADLEVIRRGLVLRDCSPNAANWAMLSTSIPITLAMAVNKKKEKKVKPKICGQLRVV